jgi:ribonuclease HI
MIAHGEFGAPVGRTGAPSFPARCPEGAFEEIMIQHSLIGSDATATREYTIVFDGGSIGNPGRGYGSYAVFAADLKIAHERLSYDHIGLRITNNQAEYRTLIGALRWLLELRKGKERSTSVIVWGDSLLVINQLKGSWKVKNADLRPLYEEALSLVKRFESVDLRWHERLNSVQILGH